MVTFPSYLQISLNSRVCSIVAISIVWSANFKACLLSLGPLREKIENFFFGLEGEVCSLVVAATGSVSVVSAGAVVDTIIDEGAAVLNISSCFSFIFSHSLSPSSTLQQTCKYSHAFYVYCHMITYLAGRFDGSRPVLGNFFCCL